MDKSLDDNTHNTQSSTKKGVGSGIEEKVASVANVVHGAGEVFRGYLLDLTDCGKGTGKDIAAEGKAEFERGSNKLGLSHKLTTAPSTHTSAASDSGHAGPNTATGVSTTDPPDTRRDADPGRRTEKETVPTAVDGSGSARPERHDEKQPTPRTSSPGPRGQYETEEGQKTTETSPSSQEYKGDDTANVPDPTFAGGQGEESGTANVPK